MFWYHKNKISLFAFPLLKVYTELFMETKSLVNKI